MGFLPSNPESFDVYEEPPRWLGDPPPLFYKTTASVGHEMEWDHTYQRTWCRLPEQIASVTVYRHAAPPDIVVIGVEFHAVKHPDGELSNTLLGFRTLWMEHAILINLADDENITGIGVKVNRSSELRSKEEGLGLENARIWTTRTQHKAGCAGNEGWQDVVCETGDKLVGVVAIIGVR